ncbi:hypothetical protein J3R82DRAFT_1878 [Butyriboletus roseoflavus]|nr:hypothetical protein J3R82DRAFT_1878 [Butyriboletus roseoflavus]
MSTSCQNEPEPQDQPLSKTYTTMLMWIFNDEATEEKAENACLSSFIGTLAVSNLVKSTLGLKGMDKILQSASTGDISVTNDGATILKSIKLNNAAAKIIICFFFGISCLICVMIVWMRSILG